MEQNNYSTTSSGYGLDQTREIEKKTIARTFIYMFGVLIISMLSAIWTIDSGFFMTVYSSKAVFYGFIIGELAIVVVAEIVMEKKNTILSAILLLAYSVVNGITLSSILLLYDITSVITFFGMSALIFGIMAVFGIATKKDLTTIGQIGMMGLVAVVILLLANTFFLKNSVLDLVVTIVGLALFIGLTAYDTQKIKEMARNNTQESINVLAMFGALTLYLDFIGIFLKLLRLFGDKD